MSFWTRFFNILVKDSLTSEKKIKARKTEKKLKAKQQQRQKKQKHISN